MNKKILIVGASVVSVIVVLIVIVAISKDGNIPFTPNFQKETKIEEREPAPPTPIPPLLSPVEEDIKPLEEGEISTSHDIAPPTSVVPKSEETAIRTFEIKAGNNVYDPNTLIVNVGDTVVIKFTAVDKAYDLTIGKYDLKASAEKGETKTLEFIAKEEGKFLFYCDLCGGQNSSTNGYVIVTKPN